jgi:glycine oxidase
MDTGRSGPPGADVVIAGGGIIGLALGLELRLRGRSVVVLERGQAMRAASWAAGGMLAVEDPQNPPEMMALARLSGRLYPEWLKKIEELSGLRAPMRTRQTLQWVGPEVSEHIATAEEIREVAPGLRADGVRFRLIEEGSVDPRDLCAALPKAFAAAGGRLVEGCEVSAVDCGAEIARVQTTHGEFAANSFVDCRGAWADQVSVGPVKGQMVEMRSAPERLKCVVRAPEVYLIPRGDGRVAVGATLEHVGFDTRVEKSAIAGLVRAAQELMPELEAPEPLNAWAGLRPGTADGLPVMGSVEGRKRGGAVARCWYATGHYRDGILLAPATARVMAQAIVGERADVPLEVFSVARFAVGGVRR